MAEFILSIILGNGSLPFRSDVVKSQGGGEVAVRRERTGDPVP
jgi:hypothetical protein